MATSPRRTGLHLALLPRPAWPPGTVLRCPGALASTPPFLEISSVLGAAHWGCLATWKWVARCAAAFLQEGSPRPGAGACTCVHLHVCMQQLWEPLRESTLCPLVFEAGFGWAEPSRLRRAERAELRTAAACWEQGTWPSPGSAWRPRGCGGGVACLSTCLGSPRHADPSWSLPNPFLVPTLSHLLPFTAPRTL